MGFIIGFIGGFAITTSFLQLSFKEQHTARQNHHIALREQIDLINSLAIPSSQREDSRYGKSDIAIMARRGYLPRDQHQHNNNLIANDTKLKWNRQVEQFTNSLQELRWEDTREKCRNIWRTVNEKFSN